MKHTRAHLHMRRTAGERAADAIAAAMGSWRFIIAQTVFVLLWMAGNVVGFVRHWDAYPFILLNLLFSTQAAYAAPIIMMSQNRAAKIDRARDDHEAELVDTQHVLISETHTLVQQVHQINMVQSDLLEAIRAMRAEEGSA